MGIKRITKKLVPALEDIDGAILMVNASDPQLATVSLFYSAIEDKSHFTVLNKCDRIKKSEIQPLILKLRGEVIPASLVEGRGLQEIKFRLSQWRKGTKIAVLGIFNAGKTSLINSLTNGDEPVGDLPGTTLVFTPHSYDGKTLVDTVGQVIDVSKPLMVSVDFDGCRTLGDKLRRVMEVDANAITESMATALPNLRKAARLIMRCVDNGGKVVTCGAGASALVAMEMAGQGQETGLPVLVFTNNMSTIQPVTFAKGLGEDEMALAQYIVRAVDDKDCLIGVSASGGTGFVYGAMRMAQEKGATTIAITENRDTPLGKAADIIIKSEAKPEGPCLHPDTPVLTHSGLKSISNLLPTDCVLAPIRSPSSDVNMRWRGSIGFRTIGTKWARINKVYKSWVARLMEVCYRGGGRLLLTPNHIVFVRDRYGNNQPVEARHLKKGDVLADVTIAGNANALADGHSSADDLELAQLMGYYIAEGSTGEKSVIFTIGAQDEFKEDIIYLMERYFGANHRALPKHGGSAIDLWFYSANAKRFFKKECAGNAHTKRLPERIWRLGLAGLRSFLMAYAQGDGYRTTDRKMRLRSVSKLLLEELAWACRIYGITCSLTVMNQPERFIRGRKLQPSKIWQLQFGKNHWDYLIEAPKRRMREWPTPRGFYARDMGKPIAVKTRISSVRTLDYDGSVYDLVDCDGGIFYAGNIPVLNHNSSSRVQVAHLAIGHALMLAVADERGVDAETAVNYMLPESIPTKLMGIK